MVSDVPPADAKRGEVRAIKRRGRSIEDSIAFINEVVSAGGLDGIVIVTLHTDEGKSTQIDSFGDTDRADLAFAGAMLTAEAIGVG